MFSTKKAEDPLKGHSAFINRLGSHQCRYLHFYKKSSYNFRVLQPFVLDALYITVDLETRFLYEPSFFSRLNLSLFMGA